MTARFPLKRDEKRAVIDRAYSSDTIRNWQTPRTLQRHTRSFTDGALHEGSGASTSIPIVLSSHSRPTARPRPGVSIRDAPNMLLCPIGFFRLVPP